MSLEAFLAPVKAIDEALLKQYTKIGKKFSLDKGRRKYAFGLGLDTIAAGFMSPAAKALNFYPVFSISSSLVIRYPDVVYNWLGIFGNVREEHTTTTKVLDPVIELFKSYNRKIRFPVFAVGLGLVGKVGVNVFQHYTQGTPLEQDDVYLFSYGFGLLCSASSMYIKEMDPKLLDKQPLWKRAYEWAKEKLTTPIPQPAPEPIPIRYATIDAYVHE